MIPPRRRDRHGRGRRGALLPALARVGGRQVRVPGWRSRSQRFAALVHGEVQALQRRWSEQLADLRVQVEDVPPDQGATAPLARAQPGLLVVYRRPLELRADGAEDLADLVHEVVVEAVAELLGLDPDEVDPDQG